MAIFSERLKNLRQFSAQSQKSVANNINMSERRYSDLENKEISPSTDTLIKICKYFNVSADYLLGLSDERKTLKIE